MRSIKKLLSGLEKKYIFVSILSPVAMLGEVLMETLIPMIMAHIIDVGIASRDISYVTKTGLLMVAAASFSLFCGSLCGRLSSVAALGFSRNLRRNLFAKVQDFSFSNMDKFGTGSLVTRLTTDVTNLQNMYQNLIRTMVRSPLMLIFGTVMACFINIKLAVIFFIVLPFLAVMLTLIAVTAYPRFKVMFEKYDLLNRTVQENLIAIRVVKAFVRREYENEKFDTVAQDLRDSQAKAERVIVWNMPLMQISIYMCICAALWFGGRMIVAGNMTTGGLVSFITYVTQILMSLMMLSMTFTQFILSRASVSRILEVLNEEAEIKNEGESDVLFSDEENRKQNSLSEATFPPGSHSVAHTPPSAGTPRNAPVENDNSVDFENVYFSYSNDEEKCVLSDINLSIPSGSVVGILGGTGSSKTTLVSLIPRLYDVLKGSVKVGGIDVRDYDLTTLRRKIAFVLQKNTLFSGTIEENLRWGNENASDEELVEACKIADAHGFVSSFPAGYKTDLSQGGVNLSGGQKQRLCIARAILKKPSILILDDSMSAVDTATDSRIRSALKKSLAGTTKIIIAQRISSVQDSDMIVVLDEGKISAVGKHDELLKTNKIYREVYESQMSESGSLQKSGEVR